MARVGWGGEDLKVGHEVQQVGTVVGRLWGCPSSWLARFFGNCSMSWAGLRRSRALGSALGTRTMEPMRP